MLLQDQVIETISVQSLCRIAKISRSTFYLYYDNVIMLYSELIDNTVEELSKIALQMSLPESKPADVYLAIIQEIMNYIFRHQDIFQVFLIDNYQHDFVESWKRAAKSDLVERFPQLLSVKESSLKLELAVSQFQTAIIYCLKQKKQLDLSHMDYWIANTINLLFI